MEKLTMSIFLLFTLVVLLNHCKASRRRDVNGHRRSMEYGSFQRYRLDNDIPEEVIEPDENNEERNNRNQKQPVRKISRGWKNKTPREREVRYGCMYH